MGTGVSQQLVKISIKCQNLWISPPPQSRVVTSMTGRQNTGTNEQQAHETLN